MGGDAHGPNWLGPQLFGAIVRAVLFVVGLTVLFALVAVGWAIFHREPEPNAADRFGCVKTYINARGEDTGECE